MSGSVLPLASPEMHAALAGSENSCRVDSGNSCRLTEPGSDSLPARTHADEPRRREAKEDVEAADCDLHPRQTKLVVRASVTHSPGTLEA